MCTNLISYKKTRLIILRETAGPVFYLYSVFILFQLNSTSPLQMNLPLTAYHCAFVIYMTAIPRTKVTELQKQFMSVTMNRTEKVKANDKEE